MQKGMYGLSQAGHIANKQLRKILTPFGYRPSTTTPGLWKHNRRKLTFTLVVDNFGVKYVDREDVHH